MRIFYALILLSLTATAFAQSGRMKQPGETNLPPRARPTIEMPDAPVSPAKPQPSQTLLPAAAPTPDDDVIKVESTLVPIPASVTDQMGNAVTDLKAADFELRIDGKVQEISELSRSETPVRLALLFDNSSSVASARDFETKAATRFFRRVLRPNVDQAALYSVSTVTQLVQRLTGNARSLIAAIESFPPPSGATALIDGVIQAADYLRDFGDGRRVIVVVSDGADTLSDATLEDAVRKSLQNNCQVYVVKTTDFENYQRSGQRGTNANVRDLPAERRMQQLAGQTGGAVYSPLDEKELDQAFAQIAGELAEQYILNYYPAETRLDGSFKTINLAVKSNKNLTVRTRKGYYVPKS